MSVMTESRATIDDVLDVIKAPEHRGVAQICDIRAGLQAMGLGAPDDAIRAALARGTLRREAGYVYLAHLTD